MDDTSNTTAPSKNAGHTRNVPRKKLWAFFAFFFLVAVSMYAGTWYRITTAGFLGTGKDQVAHPNDKNPEASKPEITQPK